jgi:formylglycine-generating enzyme required for sulfatase activity
VGQKLRNSFNLYDMLGNVSEWVNDWYAREYYQFSPRTNLEGPVSGHTRVVRGGSYLDDPNSMRVSRRDHKLQDAKASTLGFRCAQDLKR